MGKHPEPRASGTPIIIAKVNKLRKRRPPLFVPLGGALVPAGAQHGVPAISAWRCFRQCSSSLQSWSFCV